MLEEIVVSARKQAENIQDIPLSMQALSADDIERSNILDLADIANFAPGVALFENTDRGYGQLFIRGLSNTPPVGDTSRELSSIFIDGVYYTGGVSGINTANIERVEVIKGPQGAVLGRSGFSGAINFITRTPSDTFAADISATLTSDEEYRIEGSIEGPLIKDRLAGRLSSRFRDFGGQYTNSLNGEDLGQEEDQFFSGQLYFTPSDWLRAKLTATYQEQDDGPPASTLTGKVPTHNFTSPSGRTFVNGTVPLEAPIAQSAFPSNPDDLFAFAGAAVPFETSPDSDRLGLRSNGLEREFSFLSLDVTADLGGGYALTYLGGYSEEEAERLGDFELSAEENYFLSRQTDSESSSHELRLSSPTDRQLRWQLGLYYLEQELYERDPGGIFGADVTNLFFGPLGISLEPGQALVLPGPRPIVDREIENTAVFGSVAFDLTEKVTLSLEGRYQEDRLEDTVSRDTGETISGSTTSFLPRYILEYQLSDDVLLYGLAAKGVRPTTINSQFAGRSDAEKAIIRAEFPELNIATLAPEEEIWSYELGAKTTSLDGRLIFNANVYYSDWTNRQDLRSLLADIDGDGAPNSTLVTVSGTDVEVMGVEVETSMMITENWNARLIASWNQSELTDKSADGTLARFFLREPDGERLPQVPEWSGTLTTQYTDTFGSSGFDWFARAEGVYVGSRYASTLNLTETGDSFDLNLRFGLENTRYRAVLFVENAFDDDTVESLRSNADCATSPSCLLSAYEVVLPRERRFGLSVGVRF